MDINVLYFVYLEKYLLKFHNSILQLSLCNFSASLKQNSTLFVLPRYSYSQAAQLKDIMCVYKQGRRVLECESYIIEV